MNNSELAGISALNKNNFGPFSAELLEGIEEVVVFSLPMNVLFRGITQRDGLLVRGPHGWGEVSPFWDYGPEESSFWLASGLESATLPPLQPIRDQVAVNVTIPVCSPEEAVQRLRAQRGATTAKVKVADPQAANGQNVLEPGDEERVRAVAEYLAEAYGEAGRVRVDANTAWNVPQAREALEILNEAAQAVGGLEYAEQPCRTTAELAQLRELTTVPIAADESIRRNANPLQVRELDAASAAVLKVAPLGGVRSAMTIGENLSLPAAVSSALDSSVGLAQGVEFAAALPELAYASGLNTATMFAADVVAEPFVAEEGSFTASRAAAIKVGELTRKSRGVERDLQDRWQDRLESMAVALLEKQ